MKRLIKGVAVLHLMGASAGVVVGVEDAVTFGVPGWLSPMKIGGRLSRTMHGP